MLQIFTAKRQNTEMKMPDLSEKANIFY